MKKIFSLIMILGIAMCNVYAADEEAEAAIEEVILRLTQRQKEIVKQLPSKKLWSRMDCFIRCVKMIESCCRVQMAGLRRKTIPSGTYHAPCPNKCNYNKVSNKIETNRKGEERYKDISGCTHYDKNGYWFVTFVCNAHRKHWYFNQVERFKRIDNSYRTYEVLRVEYRKNEKKIRELKNKL